jgi:RNA polymerase sigma-70 factor (ECF subfamily)
MEKKTAGPVTVVPIATYIGSRTAATKKQDPDWSAVVARIREGDQSAEVELYRVFSRGIRFFIMRQLGPDGLEDNVHNSFIETLRAIRRGQLQDPQRLMGFVRTIVRRKIAESIGMRVIERSRLCSFEEPFVANIPTSKATPEALAIEKERVQQVRAAVAKMPGRDRDILTRFYVMDQSKEQICEEMKLTETQFRLIKSRTKAKLTAATQHLRRVAAGQVDKQLPHYPVAV